MAYLYRNKILTNPVFLFLLILGIATGCGKKKTNSNRSSSADTEQIDKEELKQEEPKEPQKPKEKEHEAKPTAEETKLLLAKVDVGVKNYLQINSTFSSLTGISTKHTEIFIAFEEVENQLPATNNIKFFNASSQVAVTKLAVAYCDVLMDDTEMRKSIVPDFNFQGSVTDSLNDAGSKLLVDGLVGSFWNGLVTETEKAEGKSALLGLIATLKSGSETGNATITLNISKAICTAALSNSAIILM